MSEEQNKYPIRYSKLTERSESELRDKPAKFLYRETNGCENCWMSKSGDEINERV